MSCNNVVRTASVSCTIAFLARSAVVAAVILTTVSAAAQTDPIEVDAPPAANLAVVAPNPAQGTASPATAPASLAITPASPTLSPTVSPTAPATSPTTSATIPPLSSPTTAPTTATPNVPAPDVGIPPHAYGHLGITVVEIPNGDGLRVVGIEPTSPAFPAGLLIADEISTINGTRISTFGELVNGLRAAGNGDGNISLLVHRRGTVDTINLVVPGRVAQAERPKLGVMLDDSNGRLRVTGVDPGSPAAKGGMLAGDEVLSVNDYPISTYDLFVGQIQAVGHSPGEPVSIGIRRSGQSMTLHVLLGKPKLPALPKSELPPTEPLGNPNATPTLPQ
jgi:predicted metalloprotease with PDZ domain